jgi:hypothetical protein
VSLIRSPSQSAYLDVSTGESRLPWHVRLVRMRKGLSGSKFQTLEKKNGLRPAPLRLRLFALFSALLWSGPRAASSLRHGDAEAAALDCSRVLERMPRHSKALYRRAQAELALKVRH